jgi:hypothetical protein
MLKYPWIAACTARLPFFLVKKCTEKMRVHTFSTELHADTPMTGSDLFESQQHVKSDALPRYALTAMCMHAHTMHVVFPKSMHKHDPNRDDFMGI